MRFRTQLCFLTLAAFLLAGPVTLAQQSPASESSSDFLRRSGVQLTLDRIPVTNVDRITRLNLSLYREVDIRPNWSLRGEVGGSLVGWSAWTGVEDMTFLRASPYSSLELRHYRPLNNPIKARTFWAWKNTIQPRLGVDLMGDANGLPILHPLEFRTALIVGKSKDLGDQGHFEYGAGVEGIIRSYSNGITNTRLSPVVHLRYGFQKR